MRTRTLTYAAVTGVVGAVVTFLAVSQLLAAYVEFSALVATPVAVTAGAIVAGAVLAWFGRGDASVGRGLALALWLFGLAFVALFVVALGGLNLGVAQSLAIAAFLAAVTGLAGRDVYRRRRSAA